jgi:ubiquinone/menaquinone biosynthesis C-methylase UbiE
MTTEDRKTFFDRHAASWDERFYDAEGRARLSELVDSFGLTAGNAVLDVGTGTGALLPFLRHAISNKGWLAAMDFSFKMLQQAAQRHKLADATLLNASIESIPFRSRQFDCVTCFGAFPHFPDKEKALLEMARVLRPGGKLAIAHLKSAEEINQLHGQIGGAVAHDRLPDPEALRLLMEGSGLIDISMVNQPGRFIAQGRKV